MRANPGYALPEELPDMRIVVNSIPAKGLLTGIGRYVRSLYDAILRYKEVKVIFFDGIHCEKALPSPGNLRGQPPVVDRVSRLPWWILVWARSVYWVMFERRLKNILRNFNASLYHEPSFFPAKADYCPQVFTLHDLSLLKTPRFHPKDRVAFFRLFFNRRISFASHIITVSEFMKREILDLLHLPPERVTAIHLAPSPNFYPRSSSVVSRVMEKYNIRHPFIIAVGSIDPRKNLKLILHALDIMENRSLMLVLVGWKGWGYEELKEVLYRINSKERVRFLGYIPDDDLAALYSGSHCLVYPSLYEGFGLPVIEAMACGCPVICSNTSSLPEVAGEAAIFINPQKPEELADAITVILENESQRQQLIHLGFYQASKFSWEKTAENTIRLFRSLI